MLLEAQLTKLQEAPRIDCLGFSCVGRTQLDLQNIASGTKADSAMNRLLLQFHQRAYKETHILSFTVSRNPKFIDLFLCRNSETRFISMDLTLGG